MLKVGTDFSGIGSPEAALRRLNLPHKNVFACEIDKFAKQSYLELNDPDTFYEDITNRNHSEVEQLDLYVAGFPCQAFSYAGKRKGFADETRGTLFFDVAEFIRVNQPNCFILENVRGLVSHDKGRTFQTITDILSNCDGSLNGQVGLDTIDNGLGYHVYYKILNTKNFGIPQNRERIFIVGFKYWREFRFPKEFSLDITLKDLLEDDVDVKYNLSDKAIKSIIENPRNLQKSNVDPNIASTLQCPGHSAGIYKGANFITIHNLHPRCGDPKKGGTGHLSKTDGIAYCLDAANSIAVEREQKIRRLTPLETWRLQGFTDEEFYKAQKVNSDTQLYKQAGNTITVNVMVELLKKIYLK
jgi:DNA (cytosine-5)-methyltransferase 1